jgi:hypothetical protein
MDAPSHQHASTPLDPDKEALDDPGAFVAMQPSTVFRLRFALGAVWRNHFYPVAPQPLVELIAVIRTSADQILGLRPRSCRTQSSAVPG